MAKIVRSLPNQRTLTTTVLVVIGVVLGLATIQFTNNTPNGMGVFLFVGVILSTIYRERGLK